MTTMAKMVVPLVAATARHEVDQRAEEDEPEHDVDEELLRGDGDHGDAAGHVALGQRLVRDDEPADAADGEQSAGGESGEVDAQDEPERHVRLQQVEDEAREVGVAQERHDLGEEGHSQPGVVGVEDEREGVGCADQLGQQEVKTHRQDGEDDRVADDLLLVDRSPQSRMACRATARAQPTGLAATAVHTGRGRNAAYLMCEGRSDAPAGDGRGHHSDYAGGRSTFRPSAATRGASAVVQQLDRVGRTL